MVGPYSLRDGAWLDSPMRLGALLSNASVRGQLADAGLGPISFASFAVLSTFIPTTSISRASPSSTESNLHVGRSATRPVSDCAFAPGRAHPENLSADRFDFVRSCGESRRRDRSGERNVSAPKGTRGHSGSMGSGPPMGTHM